MKAEVWFPERIVVAPEWGRFHWGALIEGSRVRAGAVVGELKSNGHSISVVSPHEGRFIAWLVMQGERVHPGQALVRIMPE